MALTAKSRPQMCTARLYSYMRVSIAMKDGKAEFDPEKGLIHFGEEKNDPGHFSDKVLAVKELFDRCGIDYKIDPDMIKGLWFKFMCHVWHSLRSLPEKR